MTRGNYILVDRKPVPCDDLMAWANWFENAREERQVARTTVDVGICVSTVFLGIDHDWSCQGPPILFETMIFGGPHDQYQTRCSTWEQAEEQHRIAVELSRKA